MSADIILHPAFASRLEAMPIQAVLLREHPQGRPDSRVVCDRACLSRFVIYKPLAPEWFWVFARAHP